MEARDEAAEAVENQQDEEEEEGEVPVRTLAAQVQRLAEELSSREEAAQKKKPVAQKKKPAAKPIADKTEAELMAELDEMTKVTCPERIQSRRDPCLFFCSNHSGLGPRGSCGRSRCCCSNHQL